MKYFNMKIKAISLSLVIVVITLACSQKTTVSAKDEIDTISNEAKEVMTRSSESISAARTPEANYNEFCASCHGAKMDAFVDRKWKYGSSSEALAKAIKVGYEDDGMPAYDVTFNDQEINELVQYIQKGITNVELYKFESESKDGIFETENLTIKLDTLASGMDNPWGITFLTNGELLITEQSGKLFKRSTDGTLSEISGIPEVKSAGQGGLMDIEVHPNLENNGWIYIAYSKPDPADKKQATTAIVRGKLRGNSFVDQEEIFEALPYSSRRHHFGCRMEFDNAGYLYLSVGDRGNRDVNPQNLDNHCGKIHRIFDDGRIPEDNPFVNIPGAMPSIYTYGNRNPQGIALNPVDGSIWENEHGPRGGDEVNIVKKGINYGWPVISYGINYNGTIFTEQTESEGMEQPIMYWLPSIGVCGMTFVNSDVYPGWKNNVLSGSLRFKYLERAVVKGNEITHREKILENIGRLRVVEVGPDGYIYVGVEEPGYIFKLTPLARS